MILPFRGVWPTVHETAFIAPTADVIGKVEVGPESSIWFQVVIRGDVQPIFIGARTNIQDQTMLHCTRTKKPMRIGNDVSIGHKVMLHGCEVGDRVLIGMSATLMDDVVVEEDCIIGAGTLLTQGTRIPSGSLVVGAPGRVVRQLNEEERAFLKKSAQNYVGDRLEYLGQIPAPEWVGRHDSDY